MKLFEAFFSRTTVFTKWAINVYPCMRCMLQSILIAVHHHGMVPQKTLVFEIVLVDKTIDFLPKFYLNVMVICVVNFPRKSTILAIFLV